MTTVQEELEQPLDDENDEINPDEIQNVEVDSSSINTFPSDEQAPQTTNGAGPADDDSEYRKGLHLMENAVDSCTGRGEQSSFTSTTADTQTVLHCNNHRLNSCAMQSSHSIASSTINQPSKTTSSSSSSTSSTAAVSSSLTTTSTTLPIQQQQRVAALVTMAVFEDHHETVQVGGCPITSFNYYLAH